MSLNVSSDAMNPAPITLNNNQATCMVERPLLTGREFVNVCTGQKTLLPYTGVEIGGGIIFAVVAVSFLIFFFRQVRAVNRVMR